VEQPPEADVAAITAAVHKLTRANTAPTLAEIVYAAVSAMRHYAARKVAIPQALTIDALAARPARGSIVCVLMDDETVAFGRVEKYDDTEQVKLKPVGQGLRRTQWWDTGEVYLDLAHASLALAQRQEDLREIILEELNEITELRDRYLADAAQMRVNA
jgi:hypothetical protein